VALSVASLWPGGGRWGGHVPWFLTALFSLSSYDLDMSAYVNAGGLEDVWVGASVDQVCGADTGQDEDFRCTGVAERALVYLIGGRMECSMGGPLFDRLTKAE
jgi:hypothetical protein